MQRGFFHIPLFIANKYEYGLCLNVSCFSALYKTTDDITEATAPASKAEGIDNPSNAVGNAVPPVAKNEIFIKLLATHFIPAPLNDFFNSFYQFKN